MFRSADEHALPWACDFKGVCPGFDGRGTYTRPARPAVVSGNRLHEGRQGGMNVSVVTTAKTDQEARKLLQFVGMPFRQN
jgi:large subunit ribosomal protein L5